MLSYIQIQYMRYIIVLKLFWTITNSSERIFDYGRIIKIIIITIRTLLCCINDKISRPQPEKISGRGAKFLTTKIQF